VYLVYVWKLGSGYHKHLDFQLDLTTIQNLKLRHSMAQSEGPGDLLHGFELRAFCINCAIVAGLGVSKCLSSSFPASVTATPLGLVSFYSSFSSRSFREIY